ncbi:hypothetical protein Hanom_Chr02g00096791 [Helianthus anomalus]
MPYCWAKKVILAVSLIFPLLYGSCHLWCTRYLKLEICIKICDIRLSLENHNRLTPL